MVRTLRHAWSDLLDALRFLSRLPLPAPRPDATFELAAALRWAPVAGAILLLPSAALLALGQVLKLAPLASVALAIAAGLLVTGALHEDGLADVADGFGGGQSRERKLAIMRDSRIGAFGALALALALVLRLGCLEQLLATRGALASATALLTGATMSRGVMLLPMALLPKARTDGLAHAAGEVGPATLVPALALAVLVGGVIGSLGQVSAARFAVACVAALLTSLAMTAIARRQIGGVTGDVVGATQQLCEIAVLLVLSAGAHLS